MLAQQKKNEDAIEQGMKKLIESDMQEKQKRADLEEKLDLSNARYTQQKKDADAAVKDREELGHELTLIVEERLTLWDSLDGYHRAVVEVRRPTPHSPPTGRLTPAWPRRSTPTRSCLCLRPLPKAARAYPPTTTTEPKSFENSGQASKVGGGSSPSSPCSGRATYR